MSKPAAQPKRQLTLFDSTCIIVGVIIGAGIYRTTPTVASNVEAVWQLILVWSVGGLVALLASLCYAELTTSFPRDGGDYFYLTSAFGTRTGFLFAWSEFWIVRPGNVGAMAFVFAQYANEILPLGIPGGTQFDLLVYAAGSVLLLTAINLLGVRSGKTTQNLLTVLKVIGLALVIATALLTPAARATPTPAAATDESNLRLALILVLFSYGGWNEMSYVAAEVRNPRRNLLLALVLGAATVTIVYLLVNLAFLHVLGLEGVARSPAVASEVMKIPFPNLGGRMISALVCVSSLGAVNGMLFTGSRILFAVGQDHPVYSWLGRWSTRFDAPVRALMLQAAVGVTLIVGFGWHDKGFERIVLFTAPVFWFFAFLVGVSLFVLRNRKPDEPQPFRTPGYPVTPVLFCILCVVLLDASLSHGLQNGWVGAIWTVFILVGGGAISLTLRRA